MALMVRKVMENRRRQYTLVTAHKKRVRGEVIPKLRKDQKRMGSSLFHVGKLK